MDTTKLIGAILVAAGCLGLVYGGFSYTKETTGVKLGPLELGGRRHGVDLLPGQQIAARRQPQPYLATCLGAHTGDDGHLQSQARVGPHDSISCRRPLTLRRPAHCSR